MGKGDQHEGIGRFTNIRRNTVISRETLLDAGKEQGNTKSEVSSSTTSKKIEKKIVLATIITKCLHCEGSHAIFKCEKFLKMSSVVYDRYTETMRLKLCTNCLRENHISRDCKALSCRKCDLKHNTLLHRNQSQKASTDKGNTDETRTAVHHSQLQTAERKDTFQEKTSDQCQVTTHCLPKRITGIILSTAQVYVKGVDGVLHKGKALLDPGSQSNMITEAFANKLKIPLKKIKIPISGVNQARFIINKALKIQIISTTLNYKMDLECLVLPVITENIPQVKLNRTKLAIPEHLDLADPDFGTPGSVDLLIGAGPFWALLSHGEVLSRKNSPTLQKTSLGWIVGGEYVAKEKRMEASVCHLSTTNTLDTQLEKFWRTEEVEVANTKTKEEDLCEQHFRRTHRRDEKGRFTVELPKRLDVNLGESFEGTLRRLSSMEKRFKKQSSLKQNYVQFMRDYEASGHMSTCEAESKQPSEHFYMPHQAIIRESSLTTKLRVVFDASARTSLGTSLNDKLLPGPNLQNDNVKLLLRFRTYEFVLTADIAQMFRQIAVAEQDRHLQRILWREEVNQPIRTYTLNTVTYGTTCAPFLAMRCLRELAY